MDPPREAAIYNERHVKIICVGAGASGLCLAYKLQRAFENFDLTVRYHTLPPSPVMSSPVPLDLTKLTMI